MIPLTLEVNAFGPFCKRQQIDFTELENEKLFLISGPTGAGKTSIFDAICYALYGKVSGSERNVDSIKSHYAESSERCEVRFTFQIADKCYSIYRSPKQPIIDKNGKEKEHKSVVVLTLPDDTVKESINEVAQEIRNIIGLRYDQFSQIVMLPQGEFQRFLTSTSTEKKAILGQIFSTEIFKKFEEKIKQESKRLFAELNEIKKRQKYHLSMIQTKDEEFLRMLSAEDLDVLTVLKRLKSDIESLEEQMDIFVKDQTKCETELKAINIDFAVMINDKIDNYMKCTYEKKVLESQKSEIDILRDKIENFHKALQIKSIEDELDKNIAAFDKVCADLDSTDRSIGEYKRHISSIETQSEKIPEMKTEMECILNDQRNLEEALGKLRELDSERKKLLSEQKVFEQSESDYNGAKLLANRLEFIQNCESLDKQTELFKNIAKNIDNYKDIQIKFAEKQTEYAKIYELYIKGQAGILAQTLENGKPCPVCGSLTHPNPANSTDSMPTQDDVDVVKHDMDAILGNMTALQGKIETMISQCDGLSADDFDITAKEISDRILEVGKLKKQHISEIEKLDILCKPYLNDMKSNNYIDSKWLSNAIQDYYAKMISSKSTLEIITGRIEKLSGSVDENNLNHNEISKRQKNYTEKYNKLVENIENITAEQSKLVSEYKHLEGEKSVLEKSKSDIFKAKSEFSDKFEKKLADFDFMSIDLYKSALLSDEDFNQISQQIKNYDQSVLKNDAIFDSLKKDVVGQEKFDIESMKQDYSNIDNKISALKEKIMSTRTRLENNKNQYNILSNLNISFANQEEIYKDVAALSNLASGNNTGKISFETYVLSSYFQDIIKATNIQLYNMTSGRFTVKYRQTRERGNTSSGLDMDVFDANTGKRRHTNTLSGGESFMLSLSLALGLSDVIQNWSGGVRMDTMFIDEGFGSLDEKSLDQAVSTLKNLKSKGRLIGIISHVTELKEQIPIHLDVKVDTKGSTTQFSTSGNL